MAPENINTPASGKEPVRGKDYGDLEIALADLLFAAMLRTIPS